MNDLAKLLLAVAIGGFLTGCAYHAAPVGPGVQMTADQKNYEAVWQASKQALRKYCFEIDSEDRRAGLITTRPVTGKHFGEFWRKDAATNADLAEGTVQTIYRQARVTIEPVDPKKTDFRAAVEVRTSRSNRQEMQVSSVSDAYDLFKRPGSSNTRKQLLDYGRESETGQTAELGRDEQLEALIAEDIAAAVPGIRAGL